MRHLINFFITGFVVWIFELIGWIHVNQQLAPFETPFWNQILVAGIVGLIFTVGLWILDLVFALVVVGSCGIGCVLFPVYLAFMGPVGFWLVMQILPGWVTVNANIWQIILMGVLISWIRVHAASSSSSSNSSSKS